jgi:hypothetical protein
VRTNAKLTALLAAILCALLLNLVALCANLAFGLRRPPKERPPASTASSASPFASSTAEPPAADVAPNAQPQERVHWRGTPFIAAVGGDATEDVVGLMSTQNEDGQVSYYVGAFDGATLTRLWRAGPVAVLERGDRPPIVQIYGEIVVAAESNAVLMYELATGEETATVRTSDRVVELCAALPDRTKLWARVADGKNVLIDLSNGDFKAHEAQPAGCNQVSSKTPKLDAPVVPGFVSTRVLVDGDVGIAVGTKTPGTPIPMALGFDPKGKKVRWQHSIAESDESTGVMPSAGRIVELADGHIFATYKHPMTGWRFTTIDGKSGDRPWDVLVPDGSAAMGTIAVTSTRVYLAHATCLDMFEKTTGRLVGTIGEATR